MSIIQSLYGEEQEYKVNGALPTLCRRRSSIQDGKRTTPLFRPVLKRL